jgi:hypothetical protein
MVDGGLIVLRDCALDELLYECYAHLPPSDRPSIILFPLLSTRLPRPVPSGMDLHNLYNQHPL